MLSSDARRDTLKAARDGALRLLYVAPERFASDHFMRAAARSARRAIRGRRSALRVRMGTRFQARLPTPQDRGCASAARSDGRTGRPPIAAFTATATPEVRDDIVDLLGLTAPTCRRRRIRSAEHRAARAAGRRRLGEASAPAAARRRTARRWCMRPTRRKRRGRPRRRSKTAGMQAAAYHAGLSDGERTRVQDAICRRRRARRLCDQRVRDGDRQAGRRVGRFTWTSQARSRPTTRRSAAPVETAGPLSPRCSGTTRTSRRGSS